MAPNLPNYTEIDRILRRMPTTAFTPPQTVLPTEVMGDSGDFTGRWIVGFKYQDFSKTVESWVDMVVVHRPVRRRAVVSRTPSRPFQ